VVGDVGPVEEAIFERQAEIVTNDTSFQCGICLRQYKYIRNLRKHQKYECGGRKCFVCAACGKTFSQKQHVEEHKKRKHPDNNMQINQAPSDTDENTREKETYKSRVEIQNCDVCQKQYRSLENLLLHQMYSCRQAKKVRCQICQRQFRWIGNLEKHRAKCHGLSGLGRSFADHNKEWQCMDCGRNFTTKSALSRHQNVGGIECVGPNPSGSFSSSDQIKCPMCNRVYRAVTSLRRHMRYECGRDCQFSCSFCPRKFRHNFHLVSHMRARHRDVLNFGFESNELWDDLHAVDAYLNEKPFKCPNCGSGFKDLGYCRRHYKNECGIHAKFHLCPLCTYSTKRKSNLKRHCLTVHKVDAHEYQAPNKRTFVTGLRKYVDYDREIVMMASARDASSATICSPVVRIFNGTCPPAYVVNKDQIYLRCPAQISAMDSWTLKNGLLDVDHAKANWPLQDQCKKALCVACDLTLNML
ncbi:hypothetical protein QYM36_012698, partial [Artemia franciscana]